MRSSDSLWPCGSNNEQVAIVVQLAHTEQRSTAARRKRSMADITCPCINLHVDDWKSALREADMHLSRCTNLCKSCIDMIDSVICICICIYGSKHSLYVRGAGWGGGGLSFSRLTFRKQLFHYTTMWSLFFWPSVASGERCISTEAWKEADVSFGCRTKELSTIHTWRSETHSSLFAFQNLAQILLCIGTQRLQLGRN